MTVTELHNTIAPMLIDIESIFPPGQYKLTLIARCVDACNDSNVVLSNDDRGLAAKVLLESQRALDRNERAFSEHE